MKRKRGSCLRRLASRQRQLPEPQERKIRRRGRRTSVEEYSLSALSLRFFVGPVSPAASSTDIGWATRLSVWRRND